MKRIAPRTYIDPAGRFWARFPVNRRYTWKLLSDCRTKRAAIAAAQACTENRSDDFAALAALYTDAGCPNKKLERRREPEQEASRIKTLVGYFGHMMPDAIRLKHIPAFAKWRLRQVKRGSGERTVDLDLCTLSNILNYGVAIGELEMNWIAHNRPRYRKSADIRRSRSLMPANADVVHQLADFFFNHADGRGLASEVFGWLTLFQMFTGCRTSELLRLRTDAKSDTDAGHYTGQHLFLGRRSKNGCNPWCIVGDEFRVMMDCFFNWHTARFPRSRHYFPGRTGDLVDKNAHGHALRRACARLSLPHTTPHALRAYYVTKRRRDGIADSHVAAEIGDKTVSLISETYGDTPGGVKLNWLPTEGLPAYLRWQTETAKIARIA